MTANALFIEKHRTQVRFAPSDREGVEGFLRDMRVEETPLGAFVEGMRKVAEEKARVVEEGRREEGAREKEGEKEKGKGGRRGEVVAVDEDVDEDEDEDMGDGDDE